MVCSAFRSMIQKAVTGKCSVCCTQFAIIEGLIIKYLNEQRQLTKKLQLPLLFEKPRIQEGKGLFCVNARKKQEYKRGVFCE